MRIGFWVCGFKSVDDSHIGAISCSSPFTMIMSFVLEWKKLLSHWSPLGSSRNKHAWTDTEEENPSNGSRDPQGGKCGSIWKRTRSNLNAKIPAFSAPSSFCLLFMFPLLYYIIFYSVVLYSFPVTYFLFCVSLTHMDWLLRFKSFTVFLYSYLCLFCLDVMFLFCKVSWPALYRI